MARPTIADILSLQHTEMSFLERIGFYPKWDDKRERGDVEPNMIFPPDVLLKGQALLNLLPSKKRQAVHTKISYIEDQGNGKKFDIGKLKTAKFRKPVEIIPPLWDRNRHLQQYLGPKRIFGMGMTPGKIALQLECSKTNLMTIHQVFGRMMDQGNHILPQGSYLSRVTGEVELGSETLEFEIN